MQNTGSIKTTVSFPVNLWNDIQEYISEEEMTFSRFLQIGSRLKLKHIKKQNAREVIDMLDDEEIEILKREIKNRGL